MQMFAYRLSRLCGAVIISFLFLTPVLYAGSKVSGKVVDTKTGEALVGVTVVIDTQWVSGVPVKVDARIGAMTDLNGRYVILNVPPGIYNITARMVGYTPMVEREVLVEAGRTINVDFNLPESAVQMAAVEVISRPDIIKPDVAGTQQVVQVQRIEAAPMVRVDDFLDKIQGVQLVDNSSGHGLSIRGGSIRQTDVRLDEISLRDPISENSYLSFNPTSVQQVQIKTGGFSAEYGGIQSGLVNVITKGGSRERYTLSVRLDVAPPQQKFFGGNPWSNDSPIYQVFAGKYAMNGIQTHADSMAVPPEFWGFKGWNNPHMGSYVGIPPGKLTPEQKLDIWKMHHPQYAFANKPDIYFDGTVTGPVPGAGLPILGWFLGKSTFMLGYHYENSQFAFPLGARNGYTDWNTQLKLTSLLSPSLKLSLDGMYAQILTLNAGMSSQYGGALVDPSSSFNWLTSTASSVRLQGSFYGGEGFYQMFNQSRFQFFGQRYLISGAQLTYTISPEAYATFRTQLFYTDHKLSPFALDTNSTNAYFYVGGYRFLNVPSQGSPDASTNLGYDELGMFALYGGLQRDDNSRSWTSETRADLVAQLGYHNEVDAGIHTKFHYIFVDGGTWLQAVKMWTPDLWQYYKVTPLEIGAYVQDKLEFQGMIANAGVRLDYFNPNKDGFLVTDPPDPTYRAFYNNTYMNLPGDWGSYQRWLIFRGMLANPPGWPRTPDKVQIKVSPRLSVSFPVTTTSKMYFNYGHFYQRPPVLFLYNLVLQPATVNVPSPELAMGETIAYEFGYEQQFLSDYLVTVAAYYKDQLNNPLPQTYINYYHNNNVLQYVPDGYDNIRGIELRLEKTYGRFLTFWANYDYMLINSGQSGLQYIYENVLEAANAQRAANQTTTIPRPRAHVDLNLHTPESWGPSVFGFKPLSSILMDIFFEWRSGGKMLWNPQETDVTKQLWLDVVDYSNVDLRLSKGIKVGHSSIELVLTVHNLLDEKFLAPDNLLQSQLTDYRNSLRLPFNTGAMKGNDKWGTWNRPYINLGWWQAPLFLNPRQILFGIRASL